MQYRISIRLCRSVYNTTVSHGHERSRFRTFTFIVLRWCLGPRPRFSSWSIHGIDFLSVWYLDFLMGFYFRYRVSESEVCSGMCARFSLLLWNFDVVDLISGYLKSRIFLLVYWLWISWLFFNDVCEMSCSCEVKDS